MLHGAVLGLQDRGDGGDAAEHSHEPAKEAPGEEQLHGDQTDDRRGLQSPQKQEQRQHLHLMVELLRPQDDIRLVSGRPEPWKGEKASPGVGAREDRVQSMRAGHTLGREAVTQSPATLPISAGVVLTGQGPVFRSLEGWGRTGRFVLREPAGPSEAQELGFHRGLFLCSHSKTFLPVTCP